MTFPVMAAALGLASFAPVIAKWLEGETGRRKLPKKPSALRKALRGLQTPWKRSGNCKATPTLPATSRKRSSRRKRNWN